MHGDDRDWHCSKDLILVYIFTKSTIGSVGGLAHMVERSLRMREAQGSIPWTSTFVHHTLFSHDPSSPDFFLTFHLIGNVELVDCAQDSYGYRHQRLIIAMHIYIYIYIYVQPGSEHNYNCNQCCAISSALHLISGKRVCAISPTMEKCRLTTFPKY